MDSEPFRIRLHDLKESPGDRTVDLRVGRWNLSFAGLDRATRDELQTRWGPFLHTGDCAGPTLRIRLLDAGDRAWLGDSRFRGERYRIESIGDAADRVIVSHNFALDPTGADGGPWRVGLTTGTHEPIGRIVENVARLALAQLALDDGGFAMHAAGVLHADRAWIYCGPSRSGKSTAVAASAPARSLGDDFGVVVRRRGGWMTPALPFDSAETVSDSQVQGEFPVAAIWRLYQGPVARLERPAPGVASASLLSCAAFPWIYPDRATELLDHVNRFVAEVDFAHLYFALDSNLFREVLSTIQPDR